MPCVSDGASVPSTPSGAQRERSGSYVLFFHFGTCLGLEPHSEQRVLEIREDVYQSQVLVGLIGSL